MATPKKPRKISFSSPGKTAWINNSKATNQDDLIRKTLDAAGFDEEIEEMLPEIAEALRAYRANLTCKEMRGTKNALITDLKEITASIREVQARIERWPTGATGELLETLYENHGDEALTVQDTLGSILESYEDAALLAINNAAAQPDQTNPGKPARDMLILDLARIFQSTEADYSEETEADRRKDTIGFVKRIFTALDLDEKLPKDLYKFLP